MEVEIRIDPQQQAPKLVIYTDRETPELQQLARQLAGLSLGPVEVWEEDRSFQLQQGEFLRFYTESKGVCAQTLTKTYGVRLRLYELEEHLDKTRFVRISNSEILNLDEVTAVDLSLAGTIRMTLDNMVTSYVSRRYVKKIKEVLSQKRRESK